MRPASAKARARLAEAQPDATTMIGKTLGPYKVVAKLGEGGMGEVYRARDTRLNRDVAIKTLPEMFAQDPERLARFEREAQVLASLNHPHIAALYGIEDSGAVRGLVMELVEGQTLADVIGAASRQARPSHGLPLEEALRIARQIAEALAAAHEHGLVHRDLKPANVKLRPDGAVKVLDFGLAKPLGSDNPAGDLSNSPTLPAGDTRAGMILGTAAYMSPEQARGRPVDRRTDVWAFGCVLYEMLTGRRAFEGDEVTDVLARIIEREPDMNALPPSTPVAIRRLLRRCLEKDRGRRLADLGSACIEIDDALAGPDANEGPATTPRAPAGPWLRVIPVTLAVAAIGFTAGWMLRRDPLLTAPRAMRFTIIPPPSAPLFADSIGSELAIAPDGRHVVYVGIPGSTPQLYVRSFDRLESRALVGTAGARQPFFAPDGESVGFWAPGDGELRKVSLSGGPVVTICRAPSGNFYGASWGADGTIVFGSAGLYQVSAAGGQPERLTTADPEQGEVEHRWPEILPGGRAVLFTVWTGSVDRSRIAVRSLATGRQDVLIDGASHARYLRDGYLAYSLSGALMAAAFDPETLALTGERVPMQESLDTSVSGAADFAITRDGTLVFVPGAAGPERGLVWVDREGQVSSLIETREDYWLPRLSPDGNRLAVGIGSDLWVFALGRLTRTRITFGSTSTLFPYTWSSDGRRITFSKVEKKVGLDIYSVSADGTGQPQLIAESEHRQWATSWSPDGNTMALYEQHPVTQRDIWILPGKGQRTAFLATPFQERAARFSPDGRWLAYVSNDSGRDEVYVRPYPGPGEKITVSTDGGSEPVWSANGREIFYRNGERMMAAPIEDVPAFAVGRPQLLFTGGFDPDRGSGSANASYDVTRDGKRFVMITPPAASSHIIVVLNWVEELKARLAAR